MKIVSSFDIRASDLIFFLVLLFLPTQFGPHFWPDFAIIQGLRVDYLSPTLYVTDILLIFLILLFFPRIVKAIRDRLDKKLLAAVMIFLIANIVSSQVPLAALFGAIKLLQMGAFCYIVLDRMRANKNSALRSIFATASIGIVFESLLALHQTFLQSSVGGVFYFFGERFFDGQTPGVANASIQGELLLRPYGTFSHPNILAGYLVIGVFLLLLSVPYVKGKHKMIIATVVVILGSIALIATMSRSTIILWFVMFLGLLIRSIALRRKLLTSSEYKLWLIIPIVGFIITITPLSARFLESTLVEQSVKERIYLVSVALEMIAAHPILGVGINNFWQHIPYPSPTPSLTHQPVHNIFLLIATQLGIPGLLLLLFIIYKCFHRVLSSTLVGKEFLFLTLCVVLAVGAIDHYLLTSQQGLLLFALVVGMCLGYNKGTQKLWNTP